MRAIAVRVLVSAAVFWPLMTYVTKDSLSWEALDATIPAALIFAALLTAFHVISYLRRTRAR